MDIEFWRGHMITLLRKLFLLSIVSGLAGGCGSGDSHTARISPTFNISGSVRSVDGGVQGATVRLGGAGSAITFTNSSGNYTFSRLQNGSYTLTAVKANYRCLPKTSSYAVSNASITGANFTAAPSPTIFYVIDDSGQMATVDIATKGITIIGNTGSFMNDIAFAPNGDLYGVSVDSLYKINKASAAMTLVGPMGIVDSTSLEFGSDGTLYTASNNLYALNSSAGAAKLIGNGGTPYHSSGDIVFLDDEMYLTSNLDRNNDHLLKLNPVTGAASFVGAIGFNKIYGLATNDDVTLYGFSGTKMITIDPTTGVGSLFLDLGGMGLTNINGATLY
jgi:hypothetical protein